MVDGFQAKPELLHPVLRLRLRVNQAVERA